MKIRTGIIGCGGIANMKHLPSIAAFPDRCEVVAFCDIVQERALAAREKYGKPDARVFTDYRQLLACPDIDDVRVCTPNVSHNEITVAAFAASKHVLCEKPMAATTDDARKMMDAWRQSGKLFTIGYQNRYRLSVQTLKQICGEGQLGEVYYAKAHAIRRRAVPTWGVFTDKAQQGGGPLIDVGTHSLDLALWLMDCHTPSSVMGACFDKLGPALLPSQQGNELGPWDPKAYEVEDSAFGFITMKNGAIIQLEASWALNTLEEGEARVTLCGTKGGADMAPGPDAPPAIRQGLREGLRINMVQAGRPCTLLPNIIPRPKSPFSEGTPTPGQVETRIWLNALQGQGELCVLPEQAFAVTQVLDAIYTSSRQGTLVTFE